MTPVPSFDAIIIGGGLAGLSLGIALRHRGLPVTIREAGHYPRHRVCGEFITALDEETKQALHLAGPLRGAAAWSVPALLRGVEMAVLIVVASTTTAGGRVACALTMAGVYLLSSETTDRWRFQRLPPPAWLPQ
jgi:2-polyprenyl-6-methoxyphenol hydroxylase-like FAD-dependent oxidoreductase